MERKFLFRDQFHEALNDYVLKVLVPEAIIYLFAKTEQISRIKAEVILNSYISKGINERDQESESSINDGSVVSAENFFIHLLQKKEQQKNSRLMKWAQYDSCIKETNTTLVNEKKELPEQSELKINMTLFNEDFESNEGVVQCLLNDLVEKVCAYVDDSIDFIKQDYPKTKSYANEASFTLTVQENKVNCTMDLLCAKKNIFHHKCDVADVTEVKRISSKLGSQIHTIVNNNNIKNNYTKHHSEDTQKPSSQLVNKRTKHKSAEKPKRNKKLCPIPGCGAKVVNLPRHIKLSKKSDHLLLKKSASKVVSIFGLRNSKSNNADIHYRKKMRICPVDGCFSVILNLSDHFKKSHSELFNNTELYGKMRNKATVMIGYEEEKIVSIFKSNNRESEDSSTHLESDSSESNCSEYKKFIYKTDSLYSESLSTDSDSEYNVEGDKTDESIDDFLFDDGDEGSVDNVLNAFENHLLGFEGGKKKKKPARQCKNQVKSILNCVNPSLSSFDSLFDIHTLRNSWLPWALAPGKGKSGKGHLPGTLRSYLGSLSKFVEFLIRQKTVSWAKKISVPCTVNLDTMKGLLKDVKNWRSSYCDEVDQREWEVLEKDLVNMINPEEFQKVYNSEVSLQARKLLNMPIICDSNDFSRDNFVLVRDYLASICCLRNSARAGNCINMLLGEFENGKVDNSTNNIIINVKHHKTKRKYGSAQVVLTPEINSQMKCYVDFFRSKVAEINDENPSDPDKSLFVTWSFKSLNGFSRQLDSFWKKATKSNRVCPVSATLIRKSITTTFYSSEDINDGLKESLANHMKHKKETAARNYNLIKTMKNAAELTNKIEKKILIPNECKNQMNKCAENLSYQDFNNIVNEPTASTSTIKRGWTPNEIAEILHLFKDHDFQGCYIPYIREKIKDNPVLQFRNPKSIYDKLLSLTKSINADASRIDDEICEIREMDHGDKRTLMVIFKKEISRCLPIIESLVRQKLESTDHGQRLLEKYGINKIINKIRYEKNILKNSY
nr:uncharacterized protein LOC105849500 [Hydra vulgaris]